MKSSLQRTVLLIISEHRRGPNCNFRKPCCTHIWWMYPKVSS